MHPSVWRLKTLNLQSKKSYLGKRSYQHATSTPTRNGSTGSCTPIVCSPVKKRQNTSTLNFTNISRSFITKATNYIKDAKYYTAFRILAAKQLLLNLLEMKSVKHNLIPLSEKLSPHVNLLLISEKNKRHYCLMKNMSRLICDRTKLDEETFYCNYWPKNSLISHIADCKPHGAQTVTFPKKEEQQWINFTSINKRQKVPFVIYADLECFTLPIDADEAKTVTTRYQKHDPSGFSYIVKCTNESMSKPAKSLLILMTKQDSTIILFFLSLIFYI
jgi:hypothetical protein